MKVICTKCGSTDVSCEAVINPNTKQFKEYTAESFLYGYCNSCENNAVLTDEDEIMDEMQRAFNDFVKTGGEEPMIASCLIVWKDTNLSEEVRIALTDDSGLEDDIFFYSQNLTGLKSLANFGGEDFIITEIYNFQSQVPFIDF